MHWLQCKKPELISMDHFWKNETWPSKKSKKIELFFKFFLGFFKTDHVYRLFECFYEVSWSTEFNSTETSHVLCTILEKNGKNYKKGQFFFGPFGRLSRIFSKIVHRNEFWFFALRSVHQDASFKLSNVAIRQFSFFTFVRGYPYFSDFWKKVPTCLKLVEIGKQKHF